MKALILTNEYPPNIYGGAGVHVDYLTRELSRLIDLEVRCFGEQKLEHNHLKVTGYLPQSISFDQSSSKLKSTLQTILRCLKFNIDPTDAAVVHCHTWYTHLAGILTKLLYGCKLVITTHSLEPLRPWKVEQIGRGYQFSSWVEKTAIEMADAVIAVSQGTKTDILKYFKVSPKKIHVIYNGIDTAEYKQTTATSALIKHKIDPSRPYLLFVGRITRQKGIIHLVNAISYFDPNLQIVLCAGTPDTPEIAKEMEVRMAQIKSKRQHVVWIPEILDKPSMIELYSQATVFCCPSIYEPFGIINLEAMACGIPVVASAVGGIKEVVRNGKTGYLVPLKQFSHSPFEPKNPNKFSRDLAMTINRVFNNPALGKKMGENGRQRAEKKFSWQIIARQTLNLYQSIINHVYHKKT